MGSIVDQITSIVNYARFLWEDCMHILNSVLLGIGLAMDAFSVSLANGLAKPCMPRKQMMLIAGLFGLFQMLMPLAGWLAVSTAAHYFTILNRYIPFVALALLAYIGINMILESLGNKEKCQCLKEITLHELIIQAIATSIDALSVGFTIANLSFLDALNSCAIIGIVTYVICYAGLIIGKNAGVQLAGKAGILGGSILLFIGLKIFL